MVIVGEEAASYNSRRTTQRRGTRRRRRRRQLTTKTKTTRLSSTQILIMYLSALFLATTRQRGTYAWILQSQCTTTSRVIRGYASRCRASTFPARLFMSTSASSDDSNEEEDGKNMAPSSRSNKRSTKKKSNKSNKKFKVVNKINQNHIDQLTKAFDELATSEGFGRDDQTYYADEETFEDDFTDEDYEVFDYDDNDENENDKLDPSQFSIRDFEGSESEWVDDDDDKNLDMGFSGSGGDGAGDDMDARIAAASHDIDFGTEFENEELTSAELRKLGFRPELNPYGDNDEISSSRKNQQQYKIITNAMTCSACGADFQCTNETRPGFLPPDKYEFQTKLSKIEEMQKLQTKAMNVDNSGDGEEEEWSTDDEIDWLIQSSGGSGSNSKDKDDKEDMGVVVVADDGVDNINAMADEMGIDLLEISSSKKVICKRCHGLQNFGKVDAALRPGWTNEPMLSQQKFMSLLKPIREKPAVIVALVDLFDFSGSVLPELDNIAGTENPVIIAANKADLLPSSFGPTRIENWVRRELEYMGIQSLANVGGAVRLISCKTGMGVESMISKAKSLADDMDCDVYVVGAANAGKSTLLNHILDRENPDNNTKHMKKRAGNRNARKGAVTTSPLPGTTLKFIKVDIGGGRNLYDTPGLLVPGTLTQLLLPEELKIVAPKKKVEPITFRVASGKCVLVGGLAKIELIGDSRPFLFTFFVANDIKLHPTDSARAPEFIRKHAGELLTPPLPPGPERLQQMGEFEEHVVDIEGIGWKEAAADIALTGLGWVAVTGAGTAKVKISVPKGIAVSVRPPLMPYDIWETTAKFTGGRAVRKSTKSSSSGKRRKGVGRR